MKNQNFVGLAIMVLVVLAVQSIIGIVKLGYVAAKGIYSMVKPQSPVITPSVAYAPIFEPVNEPIEPVAQIIEPVATQAPVFAAEVVADPWATTETVKSRKPRGKQRSIADLIMEIAS
jgi:hypothetical protein